MRKLIRITTVPGSMRTLLKGQLRYMSQFYDVVAVSSGGADFGKMLEEQGVRGVKVNMTRKITPIKDFIALCSLIRLFIKEKPDIVHTHTPKAGILGMLAAKIAGVPCRLHTVAGLPLLVASGKKRKLLEFVERLTYACATNVYPNSFNMQKIIVDNGYAKKEKLKVLANGSSNGIDTAFFSREAVSETDVSRHKRSEVFTFVFVGRIVKDKGTNELVHAFQRLKGKHENVRLLLVGPFEKELDPVLPDVEKSILEGDNIEFVGFQNDVRPFMAAADVLVLPSYREGFPNVVMQAGAMGLPCVVTDINGCNEIIIPKENGLIVPPKDEVALYEAMKYAMEHSDEMRQMGERARSLIVKRYEQRVVWEALLGEYQRLLEEEAE